MHSLLWTIGFLTIIPVPRGVHERQPKMAAVAFWFPFVGALIGLLTFCGFALMARALPALIAATLAVAFQAMLTRGLHLDGFADTLDGFFGAFDRERRLAIMRDSQIGTFGVAGLVMLLFLKVFILAQLSSLYPARTDRHLGIALALMAVVALGRLAMVAAAAFNRYARDEGTGRSFVAAMRPLHALPALAAPAVLLGWLWGVPALLPFLAAAAVVVLMSAAGRTKIGGMTGDTLGATGELAELAVGLALVMMATHAQLPIPAM